MVLGTYMVPQRWTSEALGDSYFLPENHGPRQLESFEGICGGKLGGGVCGV